jgi:hypothetical protein
MKVTAPDFVAVMSLVWRQAPALLVLSFLATLLLVLPSGALDTLVWLTLAALVAILHRSSPHAGSKRSALSIPAR